MVFSLILCNMRFVSVCGGYFIKNPIPVAKKPYYAYNAYVSLHTIALIELCIIILLFSCVLCCMCILVATKGAEGLDALKLLIPTCSSNKEEEPDSDEDEIPD